MAVVFIACSGGIADDELPCDVKMALLRRLLPVVSVVSRQLTSCWRLRAIRLRRLSWRTEKSGETAVIDWMTWSSLLKLFDRRDHRSSGGGQWRGRVIGQSGEWLSIGRLEGESERRLASEMYAVQSQSQTVIAEQQPVMASRTPHGMCARCPPPTLTPNFQPRTDLQTRSISWCAISY